MLKVYNTLTRKKENFKPLKGKKVNLFVCGPTVYDYTHIGHAKTYVQFDVIVRYLKYRGYNVFYLQNITDLDDKILERAKKEGKDWKDIARKYEAVYYGDMQALGINSVDKYARATDYMKEIVNQVARLLEGGFAYKLGDGIYYDLSKFPGYGKLSRRTKVEAEDAISRIDESVRKKNKGDFCLWKFSRQDEPKWEASFGAGRPGWHIEDTAMTEKYFGQQYDMHGGARDLIFPHHEAEIAQMEALSGKQLVKYWLHTGFLNVEGKKMSKSLGNFITLRDALENYDKKVLRFFYISTHYRNAINFSRKMLENTKNSLRRLQETYEKLECSREKDDASLISKTKKEFIKAMDDDFDTVSALQIIFNFVRQVNKKGGGKGSYKLMQDFNKIFDIFAEKKEFKIPEKILQLIREREDAREKKDWKKADELRKKIRDAGYHINDTEKGPEIRKI